MHDLLNSEGLRMLAQPRWFFLLFILGWVVVSAVLGHLSGWATLAASFRAEKTIDGERFRFLSGSIGKRFLPVSYSNCLFVTVGSQGLYLSILFPFRMGSPPLFVPWAAVQEVTQKRYFMVRNTALVIKDHWPRITLRGGVGDAIQRAFAAAHPKKP